MGHLRGMAKQAFDATQALGQLEQLCRRNELICSFFRVSFQSERNDAPKTFGLFCCDFMIWMGSQPRLKYLVDCRMSDQPFSNCLGVDTMLFYPQWQCFNAPDKQPAIERT